MVIRYEISNLHTVYTYKKLKDFYKACKRKNINSLNYDIEKIQYFYETGLQLKRKYKQYGLFRV